MQDLLKSNRPPDVGSVTSAVERLDEDERWKYCVHDLFAIGGTEAIKLIVREVNDRAMHRQWDEVLHKLGAQRDQVVQLF